MTEDSATMDGLDEIPAPLPGDHMAICRIKDEDEEAFKIIVQECRKLSEYRLGESRCK